MVCESGYELLDNFTCSGSLTTEEVQQYGQATQAASGAAAGAAIGISLMSFSSPMAVWVLANQFQLFSLLLLTNTNLPTDVKQYIKGNSFFSFSMDFLPFVKPPSDGVKNQLDKPQTYAELEAVGLESRSAFANNTGLFATIGLLIGTHAIIYCFQNKSPTVLKSTKKAKFNKIAKKVFETFTFGVYIRFLLEAFQYLLLTTVFEMKIFDITGIKWIVSLFCGTLLFGFTIVFFFLAITEARKPFDTQEKKSRFGEFNAGLKERKMVRIYTPMLLLRRYFFIIWLVLLIRHDPVLIISGMITIQLTYLATLIFVRPFQDAVNNIIEVMNE